MQTWDDVWRRMNTTGNSWLAVWKRLFNQDWRHLVRVAPKYQKKQRKVVAAFPKTDECDDAECGTCSRCMINLSIDDGFDVLYDPKEDLYVVLEPEEHEIEKMDPDEYDPNDFF